MPITRESFMKGNFKVRNTSRKDHPIAELLSDKRHLAFTVKDIVKHTKMKEETARSMLRMLMQEGYVVHKTPYFTWKNAERNCKSKKKKRR
jgi:transcription initiation factor IIE alpha subunit